MSAYQELIELTKEYVKQEFPDGGWIVSDNDTVDHFRKMARKPSPKAHAPNPQPTEKKPVSIVSKPSEKKPVSTAAKTTEKKEEPQKAVREEAPASVPEKQAQSPSSFHLRLEPFEGKPIDLDSIKALIKQHCPEVKLIEEIPEPKPVKKTVLLIYQPTKEEYRFLSNVKKALNDRHVPAEICRGDTQEDILEWYERLAPEAQEKVIVPESLFQKLPQLALGIREGDEEKTLNGVPLLFIKEISRYLHDQKLKRALWQTLCQAFDIQ